MIQYIYFVKCPNCDDEPFDFFDEAKEFALGCLSNKPIITQVEVNRNDFGECTDSADLGTIWSWEDMMSDVPSGDELSVFTKDDLKAYDPECDFEFDCLDNSLDCVPDNFRKPVTEATNRKSGWVLAYDNGDHDVYWTAADNYSDDINDAFVYSSEDAAWEDVVNAKNIYAELTDYEDAHFIPVLLSSLEEGCKRKPIPEGMTIEQLVEEMEENEDMVECTWCEELFDKYDCRKEVDLGWLCDRCQAAIMSRGEPLTFRENDYFDFLDESANDPLFFNK